MSTNARGSYIPTPRRNRRVQVYNYSDTGTNGVVNVAYTLNAEYWADITETGGKQSSTALQAQHQFEATFEFLDEAVITSNDMLQIVATGDRYFVRSIRRVREQRAILVNAERVDDALFADVNLVVINLYGLDHLSIGVAA